MAVGATIPRSILQSGACCIAAVMAVRGWVRNMSQKKDILGRYMMKIVNSVVDSRGKSECWLRTPHRDEDGVVCPFSFHAWRGCFEVSWSIANTDSDHLVQPLRRPCTHAMMTCARDKVWWR